MGEIDWDKIQNELDDLMVKNPEGFTIDEMSKATGKSRPHCRRTLKQWAENGATKFAGYRKVIRIDNRVGYLPVYEYVGKNKK